MQFLNLNVDSAPISSCLPARRSHSRHRASFFQGKMKNLTLLPLLRRLLQPFTTHFRGIINENCINVYRVLSFHGRSHCIVLYCIV